MTTPDPSKAEVRFVTIPEGCWQKSAEKSGWMALEFREVRMQLFQRVELDSAVERNTHRQWGELRWKVGRSTAFHSFGCCRSIRGEECIANTTSGKRSRCSLDVIFSVGVEGVERIQHVIPRARGYVRGGIGFCERGIATADGRNADVLVTPIPPPGRIKAGIMEGEGGVRMTVTLKLIEVRKPDSTFRIPTYQ